MLRLRVALVAASLLFSYVSSQYVTVGSLQSSFPEGTAIINPTLQPGVALANTSCNGIIEIMKAGVGSTFLFTGVSASVNLLQVVSSSPPLLLLNGSLFDGVIGVSSNRIPDQCATITAYTPSLWYGHHNLTVVANMEYGSKLAVYVNGFSYDPGVPPTSTSSFGASTTVSSNPSQPKKAPSIGPIIGGVAAVIVIVVGGALVAFILRNREERRRRKIVERHAGPALLDSGDGGGDLERTASIQNGTTDPQEHNELQSTPFTSPATPCYPPTSSGQAPTSEKRPMYTTSDLSSQADPSHINPTSYVPSDSGVRFSLAPEDPDSLAQNGSHFSGRPMLEMEIIQSLMARNLPTSALAAAIELMAVRTTTPMPQMQHEGVVDDGVSPPSYQPSSSN